MRQVVWSVILAILKTVGALSLTSIEPAIHTGSMCLNSNFLQENETSQRKSLAYECTAAHKT